MSGGWTCKCEESKKPLAERAWRVSQYRCNHSAFNGYKRTPSRYSAITCLKCRAWWRTTAAYADALPNLTEAER
jgi:hypothetical protein